MLTAKTLPWDLLRLATAYSSDDPILRKALSVHLRHTAEHLYFLEEVDFSKTLVEWEYLQDLAKRRFEPGTQRIDVNRFMFVCEQLERYMTTYSLLNDSFLSLVALGFLSADLLLRQVMDLLGGQSWATKHEILARWGWMREHRKLLQEGRSPLAPYSCVVTLKGQDGRQVDEEFYHLLVFLHLLRANHGEELLFAQKGETPDFTLENEAGEPVGAEITDVWVSAEWAKEQDAADIVQKYIFNQLKHQLVRVHVQTPRSWCTLSSRLPEVGEWISSELVRIGSLQDSVRLANGALDLAIKLTPAEKTPTGIGWGSNITRGSTDVEKNSRDLHTSLREGIERKIVKQGKQREKPSVRPCHLVVYPYHMLDANLERVMHDFFQNPPIDVSSHFDRVWLCDGQSLVRLDGP